LKRESRRVVVTGVGLVSPLGVGTAENWSALLAGKSGIGPITRFDTTEYPSRIAGEVKGFNPLDYVDKKEVKKSDTFIHFALAAARFALEDSGLRIDEENADRVGVVIGSGIGGLPLIEATHKILLEKGPSRVSPFFIPGQIVNMAAGQVSIHHGARGPSTSPATACTTGLHAIGDAFRFIQSPVSAPCALSPPATASPRRPAAPGMPGGTASSWARVAAWWSSRRWSRRSGGALPSTPRSWATA